MILLDNTPISIPIPGVYGVQGDDHFVYVGQSSNILQRCTNHLIDLKSKICQALGKYQKKQIVLLQFCNNKKQRCYLELQWIKQLQLEEHPLVNVAGMLDNEQLLVTEKPFSYKNKQSIENQTQTDYFKYLELKKWRLEQDARYYDIRTKDTTRAARNIQKFIESEKQRRNKWFNLKAQELKNNGSKFCPLIDDELLVKMHYWYQKPNFNK